MKEYFITLRARFRSATPKFFKKIIRFGIFLGGFGGAVSLAGDRIPKEIQDKSGYLITIGITAASVAKFTMEDDPQVKKEWQEVLKEKDDGQ